MEALRFVCRILVVIICLFTIVSCKKTTAAKPTPRSSENKLLTFSFLATNNSISTAMAVQFSGTQVVALYAPGTDITALKASFTISDKASVSIGGVKQVSGITTNNFTQPVTYVITAEDGSTQSYTVTLSDQTLTLFAVDNQVASFMTTYNIPALSIAITKDEKLVYAKSYGEADVANNKAATNKSLYRIASLSKQITSVAIMMLLDQGKINLQSTVFGASGILGTTYGTKAYGPHITDITVDELLHHTAGGWGNETDDPMFSNPSLTADQLITWVLDNRPLDNVPGTHYDYSNFGYCILGRVIEKITGKTYAQAVQDMVLKPIGITDMAIAGNTLADQLPDEVEYYGQSGEDPYAYNISRMDSHGGWVATASDLARFLVYVDGFTTRPDIISGNARITMTTGSTANASYACGWSINGGNYFHQGSLPGTATEQARTSGGYNFVILTNTRSLNAAFTTDLDQLFWRALTQNPPWPNVDHF
jgi:D-alanyl-D-alanine carboxypeptidase